MHLVWGPPDEGLVAIRATLQIAEPPGTDDLFFWALQVSFTAGGAHLGGAHLGLQWNNRHPANTAVNWGGYHAQSRGGAILDGTESTLASRPNDPNTRDFPWRPHRPYRLTIEAGSRPGWWRGSIEDMVSGERVTVRELNGGGTMLVSPMVWSEIFAPCDGSPVEVDWSHLEAADRPGEWKAVSKVTVKYQSYADGGCTNTNSWTQGRGFTQRSVTERETAPGTVLAI